MIPGLLRTLLLWGQIAAYVVYSIAGALLIRDRTRRLRFHAATTSWNARITLRYLGIRLSLKGLEHLPRDRKVLLVCNHVSYLDIVMIASALPSLFITSVEVRDTFFLGFMSRLGGSLFVERRSKSRLLQEISVIADTIQGGMPVVLFPEATSSNGDGLLPFKVALFAVAERSGFAVAPMCICYHAIGGAPITPANRDRLYYYGDISFFPHVLGVPFLGGAEATLEFLPAIPAGEGITRKEMAQRCERGILDAYRRLRAEVPARQGQ